MVIFWETNSKQQNFTSAVWSRHSLNLSTSIPSAQNQQVTYNFSLSPPFSESRFIAPCDVAKIRSLTGVPYRPLAETLRNIFRNYMRSYCSIFRIYIFTRIYLIYIYYIIIYIVYIYIHHVCIQWTWYFYIFLHLLNLLIATSTLKPCPQGGWRDAGAPCGEQAQLPTNTSMWKLPQGSLTFSGKRSTKISTIMKNHEKPACLFFFSHLGVYNLGSCKGFNSLIAILRNQETVEAWMMQKCNCDVQEVTLGELPGNCHLAHNSPSWGLIWIFSFNQNICVDRHSGNLGLPLKNPSFQVWIGLQVDWFYWWDLSAWYHWKGQESNYFWVIGGEFDSKWF